MSSRVLTLANEITILRLVFVPLFAILVIEQRYGWALVVLAAAAVSDGVDGIVARVFHQESPIGMALDPIADKILMTTAYLTLAFRSALPWWVTIIVISRDAGMLLMALLISLIAGYRPFPPRFLGKSSTVAQLATVLLALGLMARIPLVTAGALRASIYLTAFLTIASGIQYLVILRNRSGLHRTEGHADRATAVRVKGE